MVNYHEQSEKQFDKTGQQVYTGRSVYSGL